METKKGKDELFDNIINNLKKWEKADEAHRCYMFIATGECDVSAMCSCSIQDMVVMLGFLTLDSPQSACAIKKMAAYIDKLMQGEPTYQKLKDDKDLSGPAKDELFMHYFKQAIEKKDAALLELFSKSSDTDSDDEDDHYEEEKS